MNFPEKKGNRKTFADFALLNAVSAGSMAKTI